LRRERAARGTHATSYDVVRRARVTLYGSGARIMGVALNNVDVRKGGYGYGDGPRSEEGSEHHEGT